MTHLLKFKAKYKISANGCWEWQGELTDKGYGRLRINGKRTLAHRRSWQLRFGSIPVGINVLHHCDNPPCVNPEHLFLGTQKDNVLDMIAKGRTDCIGKRGASNRNARLSADDVTQIKTSILPSYLIAQRFKIHVTHVNRIRRGSRWNVTT